MMKRLGDYIRPVDTRNRDLSVQLSQGICNNKYFVNPKQVAENPETHKVVRTGQFAYNKATTRNGEKISIALRQGPDCTVSSAYQIFEIVDENILDPEYLMMWFRRPIFDRYARFKSHGSAHEFFEWESMCEVLVPIPSIEKQREIVAEYNTLQKRIETNKKLIATLEQTAQALYKHTFVDNIDPNNLPEGWRMGTVADLVTTQYGYTEIATEEKVGPKFLRITDIVGSQIDWNSVPHCPITESEYKKYQLKEGDIVVSRTGANIGYAKQIHGEIPEAVYASFLVRLKPIDEIYNWYLGLSVDSQEYKDFIFANQQGSAQPQANANVMGQYPLVLPVEKTLQEFNKLIYSILKKISLHQMEISKLSEMKPLLLSKMGKQDAK